MFERALAFVLRWEGGYSDHPDDPGGATNMGITQATYDAWRKSQGLSPRPVRDIQRGEVEAIYRSRYWAAIGADKLPDALALAAFDLAVNSGVATAKRALSEAKGDWRRLVAWRMRYLTSLRPELWSAFGRGWIRRVSALIDECAALDGTLEVATRLIVDGAQPAPLERARVVGDKLYARTRRDT